MKASLKAETVSEQKPWDVLLRILHFLSNALFRIINYENQFKCYCLKIPFQVVSTLKLSAYSLLEFFGCASLKKIFFSLNILRMREVHYFSSGDSCFLFDKLWTSVYHNSP